MKLIIAIRALNSSKAAQALSAQGATVIKSSFERSEPALRNFVEGFHARGLSYDIQGYGVYWLLIDDEKSPDYFQTCCAVECVFTETWLAEKSQKVRYLKGIAYCDATSAWADEFLLKDQQRDIDMTFPPEMPPAEIQSEASLADHQPLEQITDQIPDDQPDSDPSDPLPIDTQPSADNTNASREDGVRAVASEPDTATTGKKITGKKQKASVRSESVGQIVDLFNHLDMPEKNQKKKATFKKRTQAIEEEQLDMFSQL